MVFTKFQTYLKKKKKKREKEESDELIEHELRFEDGKKQHSC